MVDFASAPSLKGTDKIIKEPYERGGGKAKLANGVEIEVRHSGWKGINGKVGYGQEVIPGAALVERLNVSELQSKVASNTGAAASKDQRAAPKR